MLALLIQLFVAAFASFLVVGLVSMYDPGSVGGSEVEVAIAGDDADRLVDVAAGRDGARPRPFETDEDAIAAFESGEVDAVVLTERLDDDRIQVNVTAPEGSFRTTMVVVELQGLLREYETTLRQDRAVHLERTPVALPDPVQSTPYFGFTYTVLLPLLMFMPVFVGGSVAVDSLAEEVERGTLELLRASPVPLSAIVDGKLLAAAAPVPVQAALWIGLLRFNGTTVAHVPELLAFVTALATAVSAVGLGVAVALRDRRLAQFLYSSGLLVLFGATLLLPENPPNVVARFAVGTPGPGTYASLAGAVVLAVIAVVALRRATRRVDG